MNDSYQILADGVLIRFMEGGVHRYEFKDIVRLHKAWSPLGRWRDRNREIVLFFSVIRDELIERGLIKE